MLPHCVGCGRFVSRKPGVSWAEIYDFVAMGLDREVVACASCTEKHGPVTSNARPANGDMSPYQGIVE